MYRVDVAFNVAFNLVRCGCGSGEEKIRHQGITADVAYCRKKTKQEMIQCVPSLFSQPQQQEKTEKKSTEGSFYGNVWMAVGLFVMCLQWKQTPLFTAVSP